MTDGLTNTLNVFQGNGDGTFQNPLVTPIGPTRPTALTVADINQDGIPDLVVGEVGAVDVLQGNGDGTFQAAQSFAIGGTAKIDHDGGLQRRRLPRHRRGRRHRTDGRAKRGRRQRAGRGGRLRSHDPAERDGGCSLVVDGDGRGRGGESRAGLPRHRPPGEQRPEVAVAELLHLHGGRCRRAYLHEPGVALHGRNPDVDRRQSAHGCGLHGGGGHSRGRRHPVRRGAGYSPRPGLPSRSR